jgi:hypothetical protein
MAGGTVRTGHRPQHESLEAAQSVGPHDDQVRGKLGGGADDFVGDRPVAHDDLYRRRAGNVCNELQYRACGALAVSRRLERHRHRVFHPRRGLKNRGTDTQRDEAGPVPAAERQGVPQRPAGELGKIDRTENLFHGDHGNLPDGFPATAFRAHCRLVGAAAESRQHPRPRETLS